MNSTAKVVKMIEIQLNPDELQRSSIALNQLTADQATPALTHLAQSLNAAIAATGESQLPPDHICRCELNGELLYDLTIDLCDLFDEMIEEWPYRTTKAMNALIKKVHNAFWS